MRHNKIFLFLFSAVVIVLFTSCSSPKALEYRTVTGFSVSKLGLTTSTVNMSMVYYNPNDFSMQLKQTDLDIFIDSNYVGHTTQEVPVTIPALSEFNIPLSVNVDMNNLFKNALTARGVKAIQRTVSGNIRAGKGIL